MPIYEYVCERCGRVSSFLVRNVSAHQPPKCPRCGAGAMRRAISRFAAVGGSRKDAGDSGPGDNDMENGGAPLDGAGGPDPDLSDMESLLDGVDENDPRSMGRAMRRLAEQTGEPLDEEMNEVVRRLESGEDPDKIEERMGNVGGETDAAGGDELYDG